MRDVDRERLCASATVGRCNPRPNDRTSNRRLDREDRSRWSANRRAEDARWDAEGGGLVVYSGRFVLVSRRPLERKRIRRTGYVRGRGERKPRKGSGVLARYVPSPSRADLAIFQRCLADFSVPFLTVAVVELSPNSHRRREATYNNFDCHVDFHWALARQITRASSRIAMRSPADEISTTKCRESRERIDDSLAFYPPLVPLIHHSPPPSLSESSDSPLTFSRRTTDFSPLSVSSSRRRDNWRGTPTIHSSSAKSTLLLRRLFPLQPRAPWTSERDDGREEEINFQAASLLATENAMRRATERGRGGARHFSKTALHFRSRTCASRRINWNFDFGTRDRAAIRVV